MSKTTVSNLPAVATLAALSFITKTGMCADVPITKQSTVAAIPTVAALSTAASFSADACLNTGPPAAQTRDDEQPAVRLEKLPRIILPQQVPVSSAERAHIWDLIGQLKQIDSPDFGFAPTLSGSAFAPVADSESAGAGAMVLTNPGIKRSTAFKALVALGPRALPFLLRAVADQTPTKFTIKFQGILMWMDFADEMSGNPANPREETLLAVLPKPDPNHMPQRPSPYTVTVGDICFVAIGQIVGRSYQAVRYQPSGGVIINSPTHDPVIARTVRAIWSSKDTAQHLLDSLLLDYSPRGIYEVPAAMRLLFYYPRQAASIIADRLNKLQVQRVGAGSGSLYSDFVKSVSWCREPEILRSVHSVFEKAGDPDILLACLQALDREKDWLLVLHRFEPILREQPRADDGWYGNGYNTLVALRAFAGENARPVYKEYLENASPQRCFSVCEALDPTKGEWDREFLWPMLTDKRPSDGYAHPVKANENESHLPIRVCDSAAEKISHHRSDVSFQMSGTEEELDRQIDAIRKALGMTAKTLKSKVPK